MTLDAAQDLGAVHLAQHDVGAAHSSDGVDHAPTVAMELGERVQVHVAVVHAHLPAEGGRVQPQVAMGQLHTLGARGGAAGVVDGGGGVLVGGPCCRFHSESHQRVVGLLTDDELVLALHGAHGLFQFRIHQQHSRPAVLHDVLHFLGHQTEVDRHEDASRPGHTEETGEQACRVVRHHGHALAHTDAQFVEARRLGAGSLGHLPVGEGSP
ncbi:unannotated protein [freshwater metagenome]|uniref:Unannotated protein n=1 Tax=freshwater metagenome TaxID=449393 RepID=A0A6J6G2W8_9ZZZZ